MNFNNLFTSLEDTQISRAAHLAAFAHRNQLRNDGMTPYLDHVLQVVLNLQNASREALMVAWLHDVVEDTDVTLEQLRDEYKFTETVIDAVDAITHPKGEPYEDYIRRVCDNEIALEVKKADLAHNLSDGPNARQIKKYGKALQLITELESGAKEALEKWVVVIPMSLVDDPSERNTAIIVVEALDPTEAAQEAEKLIESGKTELDPESWEVEYWEAEAKTVKQLKEAEHGTYL